jgi:isopenicillin-N epimerase
VLRRHWALDPAASFLNHGSFGACPAAVLAEQSRLRAQMESDPVRFLARELWDRLDEALAKLGAFVGAERADLAFVTNATAGVNAVLRSLVFKPGDEILITDHAYEACAEAARYVAARSGARVVVAQVPFPIESGTQILDAVLKAAGPRVRLALLDHVTSATALVWPIKELIAKLSERGIDTVVDGAHAPGMLALDIASLAPAYYAGNCHKWVCAPKGAGFLYVRRDRQEGIAPVSVSHLAAWAREGKSAFRARFDWTGTYDPTAGLSVPAAIEFVSSLLPGGWPAVMASNRELASRGRDILCEALEVQAPAPQDMLGAMAALLIPGAACDAIDPLQDALRREDNIDVPIFRWGNPPRRVLRISAQLYNIEDEFRRLASALRTRLAAE